MYEEMKAMIGTKGGSDDESITTKVVAALAVSAVGISLANPSDVVKVWPDGISREIALVTSAIVARCTMHTLKSK